MKKLRLKIRTFSLFLFVGFGLLFQGCNENSTAPNTTSNHKKVEFVTPTVKNNALAFNTRNDFKGFVQKLQKQPSDKLNKFY